MLHNCLSSHGFNFNSLAASFTNPIRVSTAEENLSGPSCPNNLQMMSAFSPTGARLHLNGQCLNSPSGTFGLSTAAAMQQSSFPWTLGAGHLPLSAGYGPSPYYSTQAVLGGTATSLDPTIMAWLQMRHQLVSLYYQQQQQQQIQTEWNRRKETNDLVDLSTGKVSPNFQWIEEDNQIQKLCDPVNSTPFYESNQETMHNASTTLPPMKVKTPVANGSNSKVASKVEQDYNRSDCVLQVLCEPTEDIEVDDHPSPSTSPQTSPKSRRSYNTSFVSDGFDCKAEQNSPSASQSPSKRRKSGFQSGITVGYTYDAFFVSDGRSKKKPSLTTPAAAEVTIPKTVKEASPVSNSEQSRVQRQRYVCSECGKDYATSSNLSRHKQTHRSFDSQMAKKCPHCEKVYVSMPALSMHILTHDLKHQCNVCGKAFSRPWLLHGHLRAHTGEKPYGCAHCGRAFADRSNLRAHMQTHSVLKQYTCKRCGKSFALKSYLNKHAESACLHQAARDSVSLDCPLSMSMDTSSCSSELSKEVDTSTNTVTNFSIEKLDSCNDIQ